MPALTLDTPVQYVKGVGPARAAQLAGLGLETVEDLLWYFPRRFDLRRQCQPIATVCGGQSSVTVAGEVVDTRYHAHAPISGRFLAPYPFWVHIMKTGMDQEDRIVAGLDRLTLPWPQSLDQSSTVAAGVEYTPLAWSSRFSKVRWGERISMDHRTPAPNESSSMTSHTLIAAVRGALPSYFPEGTAIPDPATTETVSNRTREEDRRYVAQDAGIVVVGNSLFLQDDLLRLWRVPFNTNDDAAFFFNGVESLAFGETLGQIRARRRSAMPIDPDLKEGTKNTYKVAGTFLMPVLVVIGGVVYTRVRRRRRRTVADRILKS